jgi:hypothetical protein
MMNRAIATLIFLLLLLVGCAAPPTIATWPQDTALQDERYLQPSAQLSSVTISPIADIAEGECVATVEFVSLPNTAAATTPLIFAHGFLREVARHRDWARHIASWGVPVYLVGLCPGGWERGGVNVFAKLLQKTADKSGATQVIYGGFSAGGGASRFAALQDKRSVGYLGLDPVSRAISSAPTTYPLFALFAPSGKCNANQVGVNMFRDAPDALLLEIENTTHCHFESPTNILCLAACGEPTSATDSQLLRDRIAGFSVAYLRWRAGLDASSPAMWRAALPGVKLLSPSSAAK